MGRWTWLLVVGLAVLLVVMAVLQYRWIGDVSRADQERLRGALASASHRFASDFDHQLADVVAAFLPPPGTGAEDAAAWVPERYRAWRVQSAYPELVRSVILVPADGEPISCLDRTTDRLQPCPSTEEVAALAQRLARSHRLPLVDPALPALFVPLERRGGPPGMMGPQPGRLVLLLDVGVITGELLPDLVGEDFNGLDCTVAVYAGSSPAELVFTSGPPAPGSGQPRGDVELPLFELGEGGMGHVARPGPQPAPRRGPGPPWRMGLRGTQPAGGAWRLLVTYRAGSVDAAVRSLRRRNLAISGFILLLLATSVVMIVLSTRRAERLARRQIQFVAGVSHELKTPLAAIRSAAENLAEGVIADPVTVREYGELVDREGKRLSRMVTEILELAGMQGRRPGLRRQPVDVGQVVAGAVEDSRWTLEANQMRIEVDSGRELPVIQGDADALRRAVSNLLDNAAKHAGGGGVVSVRTELDGGGDELRITVADRGAGIHRRDLPHIFEPFFRGRGQRARAGGSGLGLSLVRQTVERHGGRVTVDTGKAGTTFTLHLPVDHPEGGGHGR